MERIDRILCSGLLLRQKMIMNGCGGAKIEAALLLIVNQWFVRFLDMRIQIKKWIVLGYLCARRDLKVGARY